MASPTVSSPGQKPNEMTSCEYASCVTGSASSAPPGRPEKRVTARSRPCQKRCTGLVLPLNQPLNSSKTVSVQSRMRPKRSIASRSHDACSTSSGNGVVIGTTERLLLDLDVDAELGEHRVEAAVEVRDGHPVAELEGPAAPIGGLHEQGVIEEVEPISKVVRDDAGALS